MGLLYTTSDAPRACCRPLSPLRLAKVAIFVISVLVHVAMQDTFLVLLSTTLTSGDVQTSSLRGLLAYAPLFAQLAVY